MSPSSLSLMHELLPQVISLHPNNNGKNINRSRFSPCTNHYYQGYWTFVCEPVQYSARHRLSISSFSRTRHTFDAFLLHTRTHTTTPCYIFLKFPGMICHCLETLRFRTNLGNWNDGKVNAAIYHIQTCFFLVLFYRTPKFCFTRQFFITGKPRSPVTAIFCR